MTTDALEYLSHAKLAIAPRYLGYMLAVLQGRIEPVKPRGDVMLRGRAIPSLTVMDGIAVIPMIGPVFQRAELFSPFGAVAVNELRATIGSAVADPSIEGVLLVVDSPGGEVAGVADLADDLYAARKRKPMIAVADEGIYSAAYWLASAVGPLVLPRTGGVGSVGALVVHTDISGALDKMGVRINVIKSGAKKAMFSPFTPLSEDARTALQLEVNRIADLFIEAVGRHREVSPDAIRGLEGGTLEGQAAVDGGLADGIGTAEEAYLALKMHITRQAALAPAATQATTDNHVGASRERTVMEPKDLMGTGMSAGSAPTTEPPKESHPSAATPWQNATNVVSIETARKAARQEAKDTERARAAEIMKWCAFAGKADLAEGYIASEWSIEQVRNDLIVQTAGMSFDDVQTQRTALGGGRRHATIEEIYEMRRQAIREAKQNRRFF